MQPLVKSQKLKKIPFASTSNLRTIQQYIDVEFKNQLQSFKESKMQLKIGDMVLAKMSGYSPWPARVLKFTADKKKIVCYFHGEHNTGSVGVRHVIPFANAHETVRLICLKNPKHFNKAVREIEIECGVPEGQSCLKEIMCIS